NPASSCFSTSAEILLPAYLLFVSSCGVELPHNLSRPSHAELCQHVCLEARRSHCGRLPLFL
ncbi:unnamed protein product, partial [Closterium sp. Naga37s-1]